jgi:hypothetical protein
MLTSDWKLRIILTITVTLLMIVTIAWTGEDDEFPLAHQNAKITENEKPADPIPGTGLQGCCRLNQDLNLTMTLDYTEYNFERPSPRLKGNSTNEIDPGVLGNIFDAVGKGEFVQSELLKPYLAAGIGVTLIKAEDIVNQSREWQLFY